MTLAYQGEQKKALVELSPFSWDGSRLWLARKLRGRLVFRGREIQSKVRSRRKRGVVAHLATVERGLYAVSLQELFGRRRARTSKLRLSRQGNSVPYHIEGDTFYFWSEGERANPYGREAVYELELGAAGETMEVVDSTTSPRGTFHWHAVEREENRYYQSDARECSRCVALGRSRRNGKALVSRATISRPCQSWSRRVSSSGFRARVTFPVWSIITSAST